MSCRTRLVIHSLGVMPPLTRLAAALSVSLALAGCGGGASSDENGTSPEIEPASILPASLAFPTPPADPPSGSVETSDPLKPAGG